MERTGKICPTLGKNNNKNVNPKMTQMLTSSDRLKAIHHQLP